MSGLVVVSAQLNVESISGDKTKAICVSQSLPIPHVTFSDSMEFKFEGEEVQCRYFGGGHTIDNIVGYIWWNTIENLVNKPYR